MLHRIGYALVVLLTLACVSPQAWAGKVGPEFRVNTHTAKHQMVPSVSGLSNGGFVVTWYSVGQDGSGLGVYGQRYSAAGARVGGEFRVNTFTARDQNDPSVAALNNGGFVVTWQSHQQGAVDTGPDVYGQRYSAAGARVGGEFGIDSYTTHHQDSPSVASLSDGGFIVTWASKEQDGSGWGVYGQRYSAAGARVGNEFRANTFTANDQDIPSVAGLSSGGFVVTWYSVGQDGSGDGVYGQRYSAGGARVGSEFRVNTTTAGNQKSPFVAALNNGGFVVTWYSNSFTGSGDSIYGQRYSAAGARVGSQFRVNTTTANDQEDQSVAALSDGGFVVTWDSEGQDGSGTGVYGQRYSAAGARVGGEFRVNTTTANNQFGPTSVAGLSNGGFIVTWTSQGQDGSGYGVYGQRYSP